jgi:hypothetical protein
LQHSQHQRRLTRSMSVPHRTCFRTLLRPAVMRIPASTGHPFLM